MGWLLAPTSCDFCCKLMKNNDVCEQYTQNITEILYPSLAGTDAFKVTPTEIGP